MVGAVFNQEVLLGNRRSQFHWYRWLYAGWLVCQLAGLAMGHWSTSLLRAALQGDTVRDAAILAGFGTHYFQVAVGQHFFLLLLVTPALVAGAITDEKARGTLQYLLTANLGPGEIVAGKFLGRLSQVLALALPVLPLACFFGAFGGVDPDLLLTLVISTVAVAAGLAATGVLASVWCRHTRDAVLSIYALAAVAWAAWYLFPASRLGAVAGALDPWPALRPELSAAERGQHLLRLVLYWSVVVVVCLVVAWRRLRPAYSRQLEGPVRKKLRWWSLRRTPLAGDPIRWKERHVEGIAPLALLRRLPRWLGFVLVIAATVYFSGNILAGHLPPGVRVSSLWAQVRQGDASGLIDALLHLQPAGDAFYWQGVAVMCVAALVVGIRCSGAITGEREQRTWEALLLTPLENRQLIREKFWGIILGCAPYLGVYAATAVPLAFLGGSAALFWTVLWLAVTVAALGYAGAAGLWCSARCPSSWRSLALTLVLCYVGGSVLSVPASIAAAVITLFLLPVMAVFAQLDFQSITSLMDDLQPFRIGFCLGLVVTFLIITLWLLKTAEYRIGSLERSRHWTFDPLHRRARYRNAFPGYLP
jgi:ABC-type transport system involved in multi-copper enzyme maturation permease subunit